MEISTFIRFVSGLMFCHVPKSFLLVIHTGAEGTSGFNARLPIAFAHCITIMIVSQFDYLMMFLESIT